VHKIEPLPQFVLIKLRANCIILSSFAPLGFVRYAFPIEPPHLDTNDEARLQRILQILLVPFASGYTLVPPYSKNSTFCDPL